MLAREDATHQICFCTVDALLMLELKDNSNDIDYEVAEIGKKIMEQLMLDFNLNEENAADLFFSSAVFEKLSEKSTEFYLKNWQEIHEMLKQELNFSV